MTALRLINGPVDQVLTKKQLALHLGRSVRWIEIKTREGMPSIDPTTRYPGRRYRLSDVEDWLEHGKKARPRDRVSLLEQQVRALTETVDTLRGEVNELRRVS